MAKAKAQQGKSEQGKEVQRGTQDELEILALIIRENPFLMSNVLEKLRQVKYRAGNKRASVASTSQDGESE